MWDNQPCGTFKTSEITYTPKITVKPSYPSKEKYFSNSPFE